MNSRLVKLAFFMSFLITLLLAFTGVAMADPVQISTSYREGRPDVHGNMVVWKRVVNGSYNVVSCYLTQTGCTDTPQVVDGYPSYENIPVTNGSFMVWHDDRNGNADLYMKNPLKLWPELLASGPAFQAIPAISGNKVVYVNNTVAGPAEANANNDIFVVDITKPNEPEAVCTFAGSQYQPHISGTRVVWMDFRNGRWDIYEKDINGGTERNLTEGDTGNNYYPDISGNRVVWRSWHGTQEDIRWMDVSDGGDANGTYHLVTNTAVGISSVRVSGDLVIWMDKRNDPNYDIYMKDLTSNGSDTPVAEGSSTQGYPAIDKETVVWEQGPGNSINSIWKETVPDTTPPTISGLTPADGSHTGCTSPLISANYTDNRTGIDQDSVTLLVDNEDRTHDSDTDLTNTSISYQPQPDTMSDGLHKVVLTVSDQAAAPKTTTATWQFYTSSLDLGLVAQKVYWNYADWENRILSVPYQLLNVSADTPVWSVEILASTATADVTLDTDIPLLLGNISPGAHHDFVLKYKVPQDTASFRTTVFASGSDACGATSYFPGPPPG